MDLATEGEQAESRGRTLRRWPVFTATVRREQRESAAQFAAFVADERGAGRDVKIVHLRIRPTGPVPVESLREHHREQSRRLSAQLAYVARRSGGLIVPLAWGAHHRPVDGGRLIDWHAHVAVLVRQGADLRWLLAYLAGPTLDPDRAWIDTRDRADEPEHLACYLREGIARYVDRIDPDALAVYVEQVQGLHRWQTLGPLRAHIGRVRAAGLQARREDDGRVVLAPPCRRPAARPIWRTAGPAVLCARLAWIGDELRPAVLVRGWRGDWSEIAGRYDLDAAVSAARAALAQTSTHTADIPESTTDRSASTSSQPSTQQLTPGAPAMTTTTDTADANLFETFVTGAVTTSPADEIPDLLDAISESRTPPEQVIEWWSEWGKRMHNAVLAWNGLPADQRAEIAERLCAEGDYEARVLILEGAVVVS